MVIKWTTPRAVYTVAIVLAIIVAVTTVLVFSNFFSSAQESWPTDQDWTLVTVNGNSSTDEEGVGPCKDHTIGGANPSGENDIGSQATCAPTAYNPGSTDPTATLANTYSAGFYYADPNGDSSACSNISDDFLFFRTCIVGEPLSADPVVDGLQNSFWWTTIDIDDDGVIEYYVRLSGQGKANIETLELLYEDTVGTRDNDPTGEPVLTSKLDPLNNSYARSLFTPDNGTIGNSIEHFIDWQLPLTDFDDAFGAQALCQGDSIKFKNYSTSANANDPFQKDFIWPLDTSSDLIFFGTTGYTLNKEAADLNGGTLVVGDIVEYTLTATNNGPTLDTLSQ